MAILRPDDLALPRLSDFVLELAGVGNASARDAAIVTELALDLPVEVDVWREPGGEVHVGASTPTQIVETTVMPVLHRLVLSVVPAEEGAVDG